MAEINIFDEKIKSSINGLANVIRAEKNRGLKAMETYAEPELINRFMNVTNQVIYGRRGTGKTHLLLAIQERLADEFFSNYNMGVYCDLSKVIPLLDENEENKIEYCLLIIQNIADEIIKTIITNLEVIYRNEEYGSRSPMGRIRETQLGELLRKFNYEVNSGREIRKIGKYKFTQEDVRNVNASLNISQSPGANIAGQAQTRKNSDNENYKYISIADLNNLLNSFSDLVPDLQISLLLDEFSEVNKDSQPYLAALLKRIIISANITVKIAAIPNRTNLQLRNQNIIGLEEGADIFGYHLDNRHIYELNKPGTRNFFNQLLCNHLNSISPETFTNTEEDLLGYFLATQALNEILIATAGIPRDFLNIFINSYDDFLLTHAPRQKRISVKNVRSACRVWYNTDKKEQVEKNVNAHKLLNQVLTEIVVNKKSSHFLVPKEYSEIKAFQDLLDLRVLHLRKDNYSHQDNKGIIYNVYSVDYGSYNALELNNLDTTPIEEMELNTPDDLRNVRRISLEEEFFNRFLLEVGDGIKCKACGNTIDTNSPPYVKKKLCNHCFEAV